MQPLLVTALSLEVGVTAPQLSMAVAEPRAALMSDPDGLQPSVDVVPVAVISGEVVSSVQLYTTVLGADTLPQRSVVVIVKLREWLQPFALSV